MLRLNPNKGEYNLYCYCYKKEWLDNHILSAQKGIRFVNTAYKELFHIPDGDKIRIFTDGGEVRDRVCRYIDNYHFETQSEIGSTLYHICEFAETVAVKNAKVIPYRNSLPNFCYSTLPSSGELIVITKGEKGYINADESSDSPEENREYADEKNREMGISKAQEEAMLAGSKLGWEVPDADPANYNENGRAF